MVGLFTLRVNHRLSRVEYIYRGTNRSTSRYIVLQQVGFDLSKSGLFKSHWILIRTNVDFNTSELELRHHAYGLG